MPTVAGARGHMGEVHKLLTEHGKQVLLRSEVDRRVLDAAAAYMAAEEGEIGFVYAGWAQASLPHRRLADDAHWEIQTDRVSLIVQPGLRAIPGQSPVSVGVPYGSRARLIILYLQTEAIRTGSREVELGRSLHAWLKRLDIPIGGKSMKDVRDQAERISRCRLTFQISTAGRSGLVNQNILDSAMFVADDSAQGNLFIETAKLSEGFGFVYAGWAQASLPHRRLADDAHWEIQTDRVSLIVQPGLRAIPGQSPVSVGVPYGSRARLIILYLQTEAIRTGSREVELGRSLHAWLKRLDIPIGGKSMKDVRDQAERISRCRLTFQISTAGRSGLVNQNILDSAMFVADDSAQGNLFIETAKLSEGFFEQLQKHPVPIEEAAVKQIANNSMALESDELDLDLFALILVKCDQVLGVVERHVHDRRIILRSPV